MMAKGVRKLVCPYCGRNAVMTTSKRVYQGRDYGLIYLCPDYPNCDSYVGCHKGTANPLGRMADPVLRKAKTLAHRAFDPLWADPRNKVFRNRKEAYRWLAERLGLDERDCHVGMFDVAACEKVVEVCHRHPGEKDESR